MLHLERINLNGTNTHTSIDQFPRLPSTLSETYLCIWLPCQRAQFPHQHAESPCIGRFAELLVLDGLQGEPLDRSVFAIAQAVVIAGEEIPRQRVVRQFHPKLVVNSENC